MLFHDVYGAKKILKIWPEFFASSSKSAETFHQKDQNPPAKTLPHKTLPHKLNHSVELYYFNS